MRINGISNGCQSVGYSAISETSSNLTYTAGVGWHEKESKSESEVHGSLKAAYYEAYHTARNVRI